MINIIKGDLIALAKKGAFDIIAHGCNCVATMGAGIALQIGKEFPEALKVDQLYNQQFGNKYNMMGTYSEVTIFSNFERDEKVLTILNLYTQLFPGIRSPQSDIPFDYDAFAICCKKINHQFPGKHLGIPLIGCGLAGGDKDDMISIVKYRIPDLKVTVIEYEDNKRVIRPMVSPGLGNTSSTGKKSDGERTVGGGTNSMERSHGYLGNPGPFRGLTENI